MIADEVRADPRRAGLPVQGRRRRVSIEKVDPAQTAAQSEVVVAGAGLVGLAISALLARRGIPVLVIEAHQDPRIVEASTLRSIGLTLCARGIRALDGLALGSRIRNLLIPASGRCVHFPDGTAELQRYDLVGDKSLYSIRRNTLLSLLCAAAHEAGVQFRFGTRCVELDEQARHVVVSDATGARSPVKYQALICADGARSLMRSHLAARYGASARLEVVPEVYKEINLHREAARTLEPNALHVWPRDEHLLIALPNVDGSYAASLFMPPDEPVLKGAGTIEEAAAYIEKRFPELPHLAPQCAAEFAANPIGRLVTVQCDRWSYPGNVLLAGDAAHAMLPFYGQGMNCAFEGCELLVQLMEGGDGNWGAIFDEFERQRRHDVHVMWELSHRHRNNLGHRVAQEHYRQRRQLETTLQRSYPDRFLPLYALLAFSTLPYSRALARAEYQDAALDSLPTAEGIAGALAPLSEEVQDYRPDWLPPVPRRIALSFSQERIWFFERYWPDDNSYSVAIPQEMRGPLDVSALESSLQSLVDRHEALRSRVVEEQGEPWQIISPPAAFRLRHVQDPVGGPMTAEAVARAEQMLGRARMNLSGPLFHCVLWRFSEEEHLLVLNVHHIIVDRVSVIIMMEELAALYSAFAAGAEPALPPVRHQFSEYIAWERGTLGGDFLKKGLAFWRRRLEGAAALALPADLRGSAGASNQNALVTTTVRGGASRLRELARAAGVTPFVAALACYFVLLARWSKQSDISVGCVVANRTHPTSIRTVGCFFNTMVIRAAPVPDLALGEFLRQLRNTTGEALAYQHVPVDAIVKELGIRGDATARPLYQAMFTYRHGADPLQLPRLATTSAGQGYVQAPTELSLDLIDRAGEMIVICQYNADRFERATIEKVVSAFSRIVEAGVSNPAIRIGDLFDEGFGIPERVPDSAVHLAERAIAVSRESLDMNADAAPTATEEALLGLWRELLRLDEVAVSDNFFELGGDSLLATRLTVRIQSQLRVNIPTRVVFESGTLRGLAKRVDASTKGGTEPIPARIARRI
jgi:kynurenine 3-monooxygenase